MRAVVKYAEGYGNMELRDVPESNVGDTEVKIKVEAVGICGSDLHIYKGDIGIPTKVSFIVGREFASFVTDVRKNVKRIKKETGNKTVKVSQVFSVVFLF